ncbi:MAG: YigZ family protein [Clostridia bacterium]|nr:YigZ family protein [Clostridia bacterium]
MKEYVTVQSYTEQSEIRRSIFIGEVRRVRNEEEFFSELNAIRKKYSDATHVCYGAIFDTLGNCARFSDDGEPGGTAGQPILEALKATSLKETLVAVVRYFGGVKLGAGGLVRAYSSTASSALRNATKVRFSPCDVYTLTLDYGKSKRAPVYFEKNGIEKLSVEYGADVTYRLAVPSGRKIDDIISEFVGGNPALTFDKTQYLEKNEI